jgi:molybdate transport repressor ModE-like protein
VEIRELRAFAVVAEEGSLSRAARRLHLSQSALSQTIQSLERQLGVQLLLRSRTGVTTTEAGTILLREGRALIAQYDQILAAVAGRDGAGPGVVKVGIPLELPADLLPGVLAELSTTFPLTRVEVSHASSAAQLAELEVGQQISPGPTRTEGTAPMGEALDQLASAAPSGRPGLPEEIAAAITYLAGDTASFVHGAVLPVDGGRIAV